MKARGFHAAACGVQAKYAKVQNVPNYELSHLNGHFKVLRSFVNVSDLSELTETCFAAFNTTKHVFVNSESSKTLTKLPNTLK